MYIGVQTTPLFFFGAIPDNFNVLVPGHEQTLDATVVDNQVAANNINQWTIFNSSFLGGSNQNTVTLGSNTTAPDGSNNAQKIVAAATSTQHYLTSIFNTSCFGTYEMRLSVFAKAAEFSRIILAVGDPSYNTSVNGHGVRTVFDLAGVQIGVAGVAKGNWTALGQTIKSFGNGWCCCSMDVRVNGFVSNRQVLAYCYVDSGSGTAAESSTFTGNGTSGIYTWRSTMLPPLAWGMTGKQTFFEDFNSLSGFDLSDTRNPGFTWYLHNIWPILPNTPSSSSSLSVSGSVLHITGVTQTDMTFGSAAYDGVSSYVGQQFNGPPILIESRVKWTNNINSKTSTTTVWCVTTQSLLSNISKYYELDFFEIPPGPGQQIVPDLSIFAADLPEPLSNLSEIKLSNTAGYSVWLSLYTYSAGDVASFNGGLWTATAGSNTGNQPDISPSFWRAYASGDGPGQDPPSAADINTFDASQFHVYSVLWLPNAAGYAGQILTFMDGIPAQQNRSGFLPQMNYGPGISNPAFGDTTPFVPFDSQPFVLFVSGGQNYDTYYDWISIKR